MIKLRLNHESAQLALLTFTSTTYYMLPIWRLLVLLNHSPVSSHVTSLLLAFALIADPNPDPNPNPNQYPNHTLTQTRFQTQTQPRNEAFFPSSESGCYIIDDLKTATRQLSCQWEQKRTVRWNRSAEQVNYFSTELYLDLQKELLTCKDQQLISVQRSG